MNCYSALTKEEVLTPPPVTLAKGFVKRVCASLAFQPAGIDCSLPHGSLCPGRGRAVAAHWGSAALRSPRPPAGNARPAPGNAAGAALAPSRGLGGSPGSCRVPELWSHWGWKRPLRSASPTWVSPTVNTTEDDELSSGWMEYYFEEWSVVFTMSLGCTCLYNISTFFFL